MQEGVAWREPWAPCVLGCGATTLILPENAAEGSPRFEAEAPDSANFSSVIVAEIRQQLRDSYNLAEKSTFQQWLISDVTSETL